MGISNATFGLYSGIAFFAIPQVLATHHVSEARIAAITAMDEGWNISMPPPLKDGTVTYSDGTKATVDQEAHDVVTFLAWASEPKMEERKRFGFGAMAFLVLLAGVLFAAYRRIWKDAH